MRKLCATVVFVLVLVAVGVAQAGDWTDWSLLANGSKQAVDIRYKQGDKKFEKGQYEIFWQFHNRNGHAVKFDCEITYEWAGGQNKEIVRVTLAPGQQSNADGSYVIGKKVIGAKILSIEQAN